MPSSFGRTPFSCWLIYGRTPLSSRQSGCVRPCAAWWRPSDVRCSVRPPSVWPCPLPFCAPLGRLKAVPNSQRADRLTAALPKKSVPAYLDSRPISDVSSIAYRRRTILCKGSGCDPRPLSRTASRKTGRCPPCILHRRYSRGGPVPATFGWAQGCLERSRKAIETGRARREPCKAQPLGGCQVSRRTRT